MAHIQRSGSKDLSRQYSKISLASNYCKILESLVQKAVIIHLTDNKFLSNEQFGVMNGKPTTIQLMHYLDTCVVDVIFFDF